MKKEIAAKWVEALRSGKYKQGRNFLHIADTFCCLGVLCDIHRLEVGGEWCKADNDTEQQMDLYYYQPALPSSAPDQKIPPSAVCAWAGLSVSDPKIEGYSLTYLNDEAEHNFNKIADFIEEHQRLCDEQRNC